MNHTSSADSAMVPNTGTGSLGYTGNEPDTGTGKSNIIFVSPVMIPTPRSSNHLNQCLLPKDPNRLKSTQHMKDQKKTLHPHKSIDRRDFMKWMAVGTASIASLSALASCNSDKTEAFFQEQFKELDEDELQVVLERLERDYKKDYNADIKVSATNPMENVVFGYGLDLSRCVGCRRCVYACVEENNQSRDPQIQWIKVLQMDKDRGVDLLHADPYYNPALVPEEGHFYMPVQCQQCRNAPCVKVCPVEATWQEPDGIVVVDYNWCIGCRNCMAACPYGARHFNWATPQIPAEEINTETEYLGNRPRLKGVVEKCTFCIQRVRNGKYPACVEICPVGARKFGNLLDENSEIRMIMKNKRVFVFKEELNTQPKFYYFYGT
jgi:Fe-S-cluster-containing dehydrogenase component